ncbi:unnamed protein product, partial [Staurois parvus]
MPKHNLETLTCVSKAVHIITTTLYIQVDYAAFFQDKLGFHLVVNRFSVTPQSLCWERAQRQKKAQFCEAPYLCYVGMKGL